MISFRCYVDWNWEMRPFGRCLRAVTLKAHVTKIKRSLSLGKLVGAYDLAKTIGVFCPSEDQKSQFSKVLSPCFVN